MASTAPKEGTLSGWGPEAVFEWQIFMNNTVKKYTIWCCRNEQTDWDHNSQGKLNAYILKKKKKKKNMLQTKGIDYL